MNTTDHHNPFRSWRLGAVTPPHTWSWGWQQPRLLVLRQPANMSSASVTTTTDYVMDGAGGQVPSAPDGPELLQPHGFNRGETNACMAVKPLCVSRWSDGHFHCKQQGLTVSISQSHIGLTCPLANGTCLCIKTPSAGVNLPSLAPALCFVLIQRRLSSLICCSHLGVFTTTKQPSQASYEGSVRQHVCGCKICKTILAGGKYELMSFSCFTLVIALTEQLVLLQLAG